MKPRKAQITILHGEGNPSYLTCARGGEEVVSLSGASTTFHAFSELVPLHSGVLWCLFRYGLRVLSLPRPKIFLWYRVDRGVCSPPPPPPTPCLARWMAVRPDEGGDKALAARGLGEFETEGSITRRHSAG